MFFGCFYSFSSSLSVARLGHTEIHKDCPRRPAKGFVLVVIGAVLVVHRPRLWRVAGQRIIAHQVPEQSQIQCQMAIIQRPKLVPPIIVLDNLNVWLVFIACLVSKCNARRVGMVPQRV